MATLAPPTLEGVTEKEHYDADALETLYLDFESGLPIPGFTTVANNIPGYMQYLDLVRDCISVFGLEPLPANDVRNAHRLSRNTTMPHGEYAMEDDRHHSGDRSVSTLEDD